MTKTVVAIYNSMNEAQNAKNQLLNNGFSSNDIDISRGDAYPADSDGEENGVSRFFKNLFGNNDEKRERYTKVAGQGFLITVHAHSDEEAQRATRLLDDFGAIDVDESYHKNFFGTKDKDYRKYDAGQETHPATDTNYEVKNENYDVRPEHNDTSNENKTIPIIEENITVGKKEVATGGVRIRSRIVEKPIEENLRLREEHIHVERNKVDRQATEDELRNFKNQTIELTANTEIPDIQKTSKVVEEVSLGKEVNHRDETVHDTVRKTEVDVEDIASRDNSKAR